MNFRLTKQFGLFLWVLAFPLAAQYQLQFTGANRVYAGSKLYVGVQAVWNQGATPDHLYFAAQTSPVAMPIGHRCNDGAANCWRDPAGRFYQWGGKQRIIFEVQTTQAVGSYQLIVGTLAAGVERGIVIPFSVVAVPPIQPNVPPIPGLDKWKDTMLRVGRSRCDPNQIMHFGYEHEIWYYDGARVFFQIADYTGDKVTWEPCAYNIARQYRDYVITNNGKIGGWRVFPHGLEMAYRRSQDPSYKQAVSLLANQGLWVPKAGNVSDQYIRETAYISQAFMAAERLGEPRHPNLPKAIDYLVGQFQILFLSNNFTIHQTFYDALGAGALIEWYELTRDPRIPAVIKVMLDWTWAKGWNGSQLLYNPEPFGARCLWGCQEYFSDLINLTAPAYAWYWSVSKDPEALRRGDEMFSHALDKDISYGGKIFSQNYRWSFAFVRWRS